MCVYVYVCVSVCVCFSSIQKKVFASEWAHRKYKTSRYPSLENLSKLPLHDR